ncbi:MAG TPA: hypothetical protein VMZ51_06125 [Acidimicrobiales bacterium]|nr:hypothetical protein [Acidimicrobiales bacterium]
MDTPSVGVSPTEARPEDPNSGQWFVFQLSPGESKNTRARVANPADIPQVVRFYIRDLTFGADGTPTVSDKLNQEDVGSWARLPVPEVTVPARGTVLVDFGITVPVNADPGDHVGVFVAENAPVGGNLKVIRRVATRLYVTVPGDATRAFKIIKVDRKLDSMWFPSELDVEVVLRNTGRVRVAPTVKAKDTVLEGSKILLARSVEPYSAPVKIPWYGGPVRVPIEVVTADGSRRSARASVFVIPWGLIICVILGLFFLKVVSKLLARRTGSQATLEVLALELADEGGDALDALLEALKQPSADNRAALIDAAAASGFDAVTSNARFSGLPADVREELAAELPSSRRRGRPRGERRR